MHLAVQTSSLLPAHLNPSGLARLETAKDLQPIAYARDVAHIDRKAIRVETTQVWIATSQKLRPAIQEELPDDSVASSYNRTLLDRASLLTKRLNITDKENQKFRLTLIFGAIIIDHGGLLYPVIPEGLSSHARLSVLQDLAIFIPQWIEAMKEHEVSAKRVGTLGL